MPTKTINPVYRDLCERTALYELEQARRCLQDALQGTDWFVGGEWPPSHRQFLIQRSREYTQSANWWLRKSQKRR